MVVNAANRAWRLQQNKSHVFLKLVENWVLIHECVFQASGHVYSVCQEITATYTFLVLEGNALNLVMEGKAKVIILNLRLRKLLCGRHSLASV